MLEPYCQESDVKLHWTIPEDLPLVRAEKYWSAELFRAEYGRRLEEVAAACATVRPA